MTDETPESHKQALRAAWRVYEDMEEELDLESPKALFRFMMDAKTAAIACGVDDVCPTHIVCSVLGCLISGMDSYEESFHPASRTGSRLLAIAAAFVIQERVTAAEMWLDDMDDSAGFVGAPSRGSLAALRSSIDELL